MHDHEHEKHSDLHRHSLSSELLCHFPYAVFSVTVGLAFLSFVSLFSFTNTDPRVAKKAAHVLFHSFHFMHLVFAAVGTVITYRRFSNNVVKAMIVGIVSPAIFCVLSDAVLPVLTGRLLGAHMHFHLCFYKEPYNVLPFLIIGMITGLIMSYHHNADKSLYALHSHAVHIFVSSLASTFYLVANGFSHWYENIGMVFLSLIVAVVIPCTLSDVVVPMIMAIRAEKKG